MSRREEVLRDCLADMREAVDRILRRFEGISDPDQFEASDDGLLRMDAIAMMLLWLGESIRSFEKNGGGDLLEKHPEVDWRGAKGMRNILAHGYRGVDPQVVFLVCRDRIPGVANALNEISRELPDDSRP